MKPLWKTLSLAAGCLAYTQVTNADMIDRHKWADEVVNYSDRIQNFSGEMMRAATEWWALGRPDADVNGNGYAWDDGVDRDYVAGWRADAPGEFIVVKFDAGLPDLEGTDLVIHMYCGPKANASVSASVDNTSYIRIGSIVGGQGPGTPGVFYDAEFDFRGLFASDVHYIKVQRVANTAKTGMFFDSFASTAVPEPTGLSLAVVGSLLIAACWIASRQRADRQLR